MWQAGHELRTEKKTFGTFRGEKKAMAWWCASFHPDLVIMESTGIYRMFPYAFLEKVGIQPAVVNARQVRQTEGKKNDMGDAEWPSHVGRPGVFNRSFIPSALYREVRLHSRYLLRLTDEVGAERNRFHKVPAHAGFNLSVVFPDPHGVNAGKYMEGILAGLSAEEILKTVKVSRLRKASPEQVRNALDGELTDRYRCILNIQDYIVFLQERIGKIQAGSQASSKLNILMLSVCCSLSPASAKKLP
ncbi:MAG: transposase [Desulfovibrio sp.]|nr:transposase [Desulfovibrio sp.]